MNARTSRLPGASFLRYFRDPNVSTVRKLVGVGAVAYLFMPVDLVPDILPIIGWLDDVGVLSAAGLFMSRELKRHASQAGGSGDGLRAVPGSP